MLAVVRRSVTPNDIQLAEKKVPKPGPGEVLIKVEAAGVCSSDVINANKKLEIGGRVQPPVVMGHEGAGTIAAIGDGVSKIKIGDNVTSETTFSVCESCFYCQSGRLNLCCDRRSLGSTADGFFANYLVAAESSIHVLGHLSFEEGALLEPLSCAVHAFFERAQVKKGSAIGIIGAGVMGLFIATLAKLHQCTIYFVCTEHSLPRVEIIQKYIDLDKVINRDRDSAVKIIHKATECGLDAVFECSGSLNAIEDAIEIIRPGGSFITVGEYKDTFNLDFSSVFVAREITMLGSRSTTPSSWSKAVELAKEGNIPLSSFVSGKYKLDQWEHVFQMVRKKKGLKYLLVP